jgi:hypothetical protein
VGTMLPTLRLLFMLSPENSSFLTGLSARFGMTSV